MKVKDVGFDEAGDVEYTVTLTLEERNWLAAYERIASKLSDGEMEPLHSFAIKASCYDRTKCESFVHMLEALTLAMWPQSRR